MAEPEALPRSVALAQELLMTGRPVAASVAPSFPASTPEDRLVLFPMAIRSLGFTMVEPTNVVLPQVMGMRLAECGEHPEKVRISSCCPRVVALVESRFPEAEPYLSRTFSPAVLHARELRRELGESSCVVFFSPCPDKRLEVRRPENRGGPDVVVTFREMHDWLRQSGAWEKAASSCALLGECGTALGFQREAPFWTYAGLLVGDARGIQECSRMLGRLHTLTPGFYELLACPDGCLGGSGMPDTYALEQRKEAIVRYMKSLEQSLAEAETPTAR